MGIADRLDALRNSFPGCEALVLTDLETGMPLCASTRVRQPQEDIDQLSDTATQLLGDEVAALTSAPIRLAIVIEGGAVGLFLRAAHPGTEALCCDLSGDGDLGHMARGAQHLLAAIVAEP